MRMLKLGDGEEGIEGLRRGKGYGRFAPRSGKESVSVFFDQRIFLERVYCSWSLLSQYVCSVDSPCRLHRQVEFHLVDLSDLMAVMEDSIS